MKVGPFLTYMARLKGVDNHVVASKIRSWLDRVGLADCIRKKCEELSKGMQQKVQFVASVLHEPDLLILDEPFSGLDPVNRKLLRELIDEQHKAGRTIIFSTHAMYEAEQLCERLMMINRGRKVLDMPMRDIWNKFDPRTIVIEPLNSDERVETGSLRSLAGVSSVHDVRGGVEVQLADTAEAGTVMGAVASLVRARRIELKRVSVEDVFINLVQQSGGSGEELEHLRSELTQDRVAIGSGS
jgi:ABC-2 type transport system ATP-binding protein